jgi:antitoxin YefM
MLEAVMRQVSYSQLRNNLASCMDEVCDSRDALHITRRNARSVVMISEQEYASIMETFQGDALRRDAFRCIC